MRYTYTIIVGVQLGALGADGKIIIANCISRKQNKKM
jgi:hypothetical protein